jgi:hypothetical protein
MLNFKKNFESAVAEALLPVGAPAERRASPAMTEWYVPTTRSAGGNFSVVDDVVTLVGGGAVIVDVADAFCCSTTFLACNEATGAVTAAVSSRGRFAALADDFLAILKIT